MASAQTLNRRGFLAMAAAAGTVGIGVAASGTARAAGVDWVALRNALDGALILPGDAKYAAAA